MTRPIRCPTFSRNRVLDTRARSFCLFSTHALKELLSTRPGPFVPHFRVAVVYRIVMNVVYTRPKMAGRFDSTVQAIVPNLTSAPLIFSVPAKRCPPVQFSQFATELFKPGCSKQQMIVV